MRVSNAQRGQSLLTDVWSAILADWPIYLGLVIYLACGTVYVRAQSYVLFDGLSAYLPAALLTYGVVMPLVMFSLGLAVIVHRLNRRRGLAVRLMLGRRRLARFVAGTLLTLVVLVLFGSMFASVKSAFSIHGFAFDKGVADFNDLIHFGHSPGHWLRLLFGGPIILRFIEDNYEISWSVFCFGFFYWVAVAPQADAIRIRYCLTFMLTWSLIGNVIAGIVTTAGPAYYARVTGDASRFPHLHAILASSPNGPGSAASIQNYLWYLHETQASGFGAGISAFPSIHVTMVTLTTLFLLERNRVAGLVAVAFTSIIMVSSVYLGWHYAVDGYAAVVLTIAIYWSVRWLVAPRPLARSVVDAGAGDVISLPGSARPGAA